MGTNWTKLTILVPPFPSLQKDVFFPVQRNPPRRKDSNTKHVNVAMLNVNIQLRQCGKIWRCGPGWSFHGNFFLLLCVLGKWFHATWAQFHYTGGDLSLVIFYKNYGEWKTGLTAVRSMQHSSLPKSIALPMLLTHRWCTLFINLMHLKHVIL